MTDSIPLDQLGSGKPGDDGLRRDQWGRLLVVPPEGGKPKGYTRVTTVAKTLDDGGGLMPWKSTMTAVGLMRRPGLRAQWESLIASHGGDPWYDSDESKAACKRLVEETAQAGGSSDRSEMGTALHAITALVDRGILPQHQTPQTEADVNAYVDALIAYGITITQLADGPAVEVTVTLDDHQVGGSFDRLYNVPGYELPMIGDLKTGADLSYSWPSIAIQEAAYSRGQAIYRQGATASEDARLPMPEVDQVRGLVVWLPAGEARCELHVVDLEAGWFGFELSMIVRKWRTRKAGVVAPLSVWREAPTVAVIQDDSPPPALGRFGRVEAESTERPRQTLRYWLQKRIDIVGAHSEQARADLGRSWPVGMPTLAASHDHTAEQLALIERLLDEVEARHSVPFGEPAPGQTGTGHRSETPTRLATVMEIFPGATLIPQGDTK